MVDKIATLKNLHQEFPRYQLETMLKIIDCIVESDVKEDGMLLTPKKKHLEDRTSNKQTVINPNPGNGYVGKTEN